MPSLIFRSGKNVYAHCPHSVDGLKLSNLAVEFGALGLLARDAKVGWSYLHLFALAIELGFKSLALRSGASPTECKKAGHTISKIFALVEKHGTSVPADLKRRLGNDEWFKSMIDSRYPLGEPQVFTHSNYPEMISQILEIPCSSPLGFEGGNAISEIRGLANKFRGIRNERSGRGSRATL